MRYLRVEPKRAKVGVFDFTSCEGCELQFANKEDTLVPFLKSVDIVHFREVSSATSDDYEIAFIEGAITRDDEIARLKDIRSHARVLVALGSCACFGGVARLKNDHDLAAANAEVYGDRPKDTLPTRAVHEVVPVDLDLPGCPVSKDEVERLVLHLAFDVPFQLPAYPVCIECKQRFTSCVWDKGQLCLGAVSRAGCNAPCPAGGLGCWGCRGAAPDANVPELVEIARSRGYSDREIEERFGFFGGFHEVRR